MPENKYSYKYPRPAYSTDAAIFNNSKILLIKRGHYPFEGLWALPGGFMDMDETPEHAASRELEEETGLIIKNLKQFRTYGTIDRDPRHRTITTVFYHQLKDGESSNIKAGDDAAEAQWYDIDDLPNLAFDHNLVIKELIEFLR